MCSERREEVGNKNPFKGVFIIADEFEKKIFQVITSLLEGTH
jgi:hypothetical protein